MAKATTPAPALEWHREGGTSYGHGADHGVYRVNRINSIYVLSHWPAPLGLESLESVRSLGGHESRKAARKAAEDHHAIKHYGLKDHEVHAVREAHGHGPGKLLGQHPDAVRYHVDRAVDEMARRHPDEKEWIRKSVGARVDVLTNPAVKRFVSAMQEHMLEASRPTFKPGDRVIHQFLGLGKIQRCLPPEMDDEQRGPAYEVAYPEFDITLYQAELVPMEQTDVKTRPVPLKGNARPVQPSAPPHPALELTEAMRPHMGAVVQAQKEEQAAQLAAVQDGDGEGDPEGGSDEGGDDSGGDAGGGAGGNGPFGKSEDGLSKARRQKARKHAEALPWEEVHTENDHWAVAPSHHGDYGIMHHDGAFHVAHTPLERLRGPDGRMSVHRQLGGHGSTDIGSAKSMDEAKELAENHHIKTHYGLSDEHVAAVNRAWPNEGTRRFIGQHPDAVKHDVARAMRAHGGERNEDFGKSESWGPSAPLKWTRFGAAREAETPHGFYRHWPEQSHGPDSRETVSYHPRLPSERGEEHYAGHNHPDFKVWHGHWGETSPAQAENHNAMRHHGLSEEDVEHHRKAFPEQPFGAADRFHGKEPGMVQTEVKRAREHFSKSDTKSSDELKWTHIPTPAEHPDHLERWEAQGSHHYTIQSFKGTHADGSHPYSLISNHDPQGSPHHWKPVTQEGRQVGWNESRGNVLGVRGHHYRALEDAQAAAYSHHLQNLHGLGSKHVQAVREVHGHGPEKFAGQHPDMVRVHINRALDEMHRRDGDPAWLKLKKSEGSEHINWESDGGNGLHGKTAHGYYHITGPNGGVRRKSPPYSLRVTYTDNDWNVSHGPHSRSLQMAKNRAADHHAKKTFGLTNHDSIALHRAFQKLPRHFLGQHPDAVKAHVKRARAEMARLHPGDKRWASSDLDKSQLVANALQKVGPTKRENKAKKRAETLSYSGLDGDEGLHWGRAHRRAEKGDPLIRPTSTIRGNRVDSYPTPKLPGGRSMSDVGKDGVPASELVEKVGPDKVRNKAAKRQWIRRPEPDFNEEEHVRLGRLYHRVRYPSDTLELPARREFGNRVDDNPTPNLPGGRDMRDVGKDGVPASELIDKAKVDEWQADQVRDSLRPLITDAAQVEEVVANTKHRRREYRAERAAFEDRDPLTDPPDVNYGPRTQGRPNKPMKPEHLKAMGPHPSKDKKEGPRAGDPELLDKASSVDVKGSLVTVKLAPIWDKRAVVELTPEQREREAKAAKLRGALSFADDKIGALSLPDDAAGAVSIKKAEALRKANPIDWGENLEGGKHGIAPHGTYVIDPHDGRNGHGVHYYKDDGEHGEHLGWSKSFEGGMKRAAGHHAVTHYGLSDRQKKAVWRTWPKHGPRRFIGMNEDHARNEIRRAEEYAAGFDSDVKKSDVSVLADAIVKAKVDYAWRKHPGKGLSTAYDEARSLNRRGVTAVRDERWGTSQRAGGMSARNVRQFHDDLDPDAATAVRGSGPKSKLPGGRSRADEEGVPAGSPEMLDKAKIDAELNEHEKRGARNRRNTRRPGERPFQRIGTPKGDVLAADPRWEASHSALEREQSKRAEILNQPQPKLPGGRSMADVSASGTPQELEKAENEKGSKKLFFRSTNLYQSRHWANAPHGGYEIRHGSHPDGGYVFRVSYAENPPKHSDTISLEPKKHVADRSTFKEARDEATSHNIRTHYGIKPHEAHAVSLAWPGENGVHRFQGQHPAQVKADVARAMQAHGDHDEVHAIRVEHERNVLADKHLEAAKHHSRRQALMGGAGMGNKTPDAHYRMMHHHLQAHNALRPHNRMSSDDMPNPQPQSYVKGNSPWQAFKPHEHDHLLGNVDPHKSLLSSGIGGGKKLKKGGNRENKAKKGQWEIARGAKSLPSAPPEQQKHYARGDRNAQQAPDFRPRSGNERRMWVGDMDDRAQLDPLTEFTFPRMEQENRIRATRAQPKTPDLGGKIPANDPDGVPAGHPSMLDKARVDDYRTIDQKIEARQNRHFRSQLDPDTTRTGHGGHTYAVMTGWPEEHGDDSSAPGAPVDPLAYPRGHFHRRPAVGPKKKLPGGRDMRDVGAGGVPASSPELLDKSQIRERLTAFFKGNRENRAKRQAWHEKEGWDTAESGIRELASDSGAGPYNHEVARELARRQGREYHWAQRLTDDPMSYRGENLLAVTQVSGLGPETRKETQRARIANTRRQPAPKFPDPHPSKDVKDGPKAGDPEMLDKTGPTKRQNKERKRSYLQGEGWYNNPEIESPNSDEALSTARRQQHRAAEVDSLTWPVRQGWGSRVNYTGDRPSKAGLAAMGPHPSKTLPEGTPAGDPSMLDDEVKSPRG